MEKYLRDIEPGTIVGSIEEVHTWGIVPMQELVNLLDEAIEDHLEGTAHGPVVSRFIFIMYSMKSLLDSVDRAIFKFAHWQMKIEKAVKESGTNVLEETTARG